MSKRSIWILSVGTVLAILVLLITYTNSLDTTPTPTSTASAITIVIVTPSPTATPTVEPTQVPTATPTVTPTEAVPTATPTVAPTEVPTVAPTAEPTQVPTATPTVTPTEVPTVAPTAEPTQAPTATPTVAPTEAISIPEEKYTSVDEELSKITIMGGIYPDYNSVPAYDLYNYIDVSGLEQARLFEIVRKPYESGIAQWININFATEGSAIDRLSFALNSSICGKCGRVKIVEAPTNLSQITAIFDEIEQDGTQEAANRVLLDYLYKYTRQNPNNPYERLIISCNE